MGTLQGCFFYVCVLVLHAHEHAGYAYLSSVTLLPYLIPFKLLDRLSNWSLPLQLGWMVKELPGSTYVFFPFLRVTVVWEHTHFFFQGSTFHYWKNQLAHVEQKIANQTLQFKVL